MLFFHLALKYNFQVCNRGRPTTKGKPKAKRITIMKFRMTNHNNSTEEKQISWHLIFQHVAVPMILIQTLLQRKEILLPYSFPEKSASNLELFFLFIRMVTNESINKIMVLTKIPECCFSGKECSSTCVLTIDTIQPW